MPQGRQAAGFPLKPGPAQLCSNFAMWGLSALAPNTRRTPSARNHTGKEKLNIDSHQPTKAKPEFQRAAVPCLASAYGLFHTHTHPENLIQNGATPPKKTGNSQGGNFYLFRVCLIRCDTVRKFAREKKNVSKPEAKQNVARWRALCTCSRAFTVFFTHSHSQRHKQQDPTLGAHENSEQTALISPSLQGSIC